MELQRKGLLEAGLGGSGGAGWMEAGLFSVCAWFYFRGCFEVNRGVFLVQTYSRKKFAQAE